MAPRCRFEGIKTARIQFAPMFSNPLFVDCATRRFLWAVFVLANYSSVLAMRIAV